MPCRTVWAFLLFVLVLAHPFFILATPTGQQPAQKSAEIRSGLMQWIADHLAIVDLYRQGEPTKRSSGWHSALQASSGRWFNGSWESWTFS